jgi:hypothetical protein
MLSQRFEFPIAPEEDWFSETLGESYTDKELLEDMQNSFANDPAPGIDAIPDAKAIRIGPWSAPPLVSEPNSTDADNEYLRMMFAEMSVESYIRNCIQFDIDALDILSIIKKVCGEDITGAAITFLKECDDLTVTNINTVDGVLKSDQWPTNPNI